MMKEKDDSRSNEVIKKLKKKLIENTLNEENERKEVDGVLLPQESMLSKVKNKLRRRELYIEYKKEKNKAKRELRKQRAKEYKALGDEAPPKQVPKTIESTREPDETWVQDNDEDVLEDEDLDEFADYFNKVREPKVLITTVDNPHTKTIKFCRELKQSIPGAEFRWRNRTAIKRMVVLAAERGYTDIVIINEDVRKPTGMIQIHLPNGPTAFYKLSSVRYCNKIKKRAKISLHRPEVILNNFNTRLGHTIGRMIASMYHYEPEFKGRRVVTFHNQRDYIFFRHHR